MVAPGFLALATQNGQKNGKGASAIRRDVIVGGQPKDVTIGSAPLDKGVPGQSGKYGGINPGGMYGVGTPAPGTNPSQEKAGQIGAGSMASGRPVKYGEINPDGRYYDGSDATQSQGEWHGGAIGEAPSAGGTPGQSGQYGGINPGGMYSGGLLEQAAGGSAADPYINKETDTVEGRMNNLLSQDSDYMRRAATRGMQTAASRGLLNSSMAAGAAQASAIDASLPIAQQDAATYSGFATRNQQYDQQQGLNADQFAQERAIKQWEQDNLAYSQLIKGISDINMQDMSKTAKDQAIKNLWEMYQKARPISSSLSNVSIVDGKIVRGSGGSASGGGAGTNSGGSAGAGSGGGGGPAGGSGAGANAATQKSYFDFKSTKEMPQWVRDSYKARYGNIEPPKAQAIEGVIQYANEKFKKYLSPVKTARVGDREVQYSPGSYGGATFSSFEAAKAYKEFITKELKKAGLPTDEKTLSTVAAGPDWKAPPSTYLSLGTNGD